MNEVDISRSNPLGWNCLYLVPRGQGYYEVAGTNRPQGWNAWLTFTIALNKSDK